MVGRCYFLDLLKTLLSTPWYVGEFKFATAAMSDLQQQTIDHISLVTAHEELTPIWAELREFSKFNLYIWN